jgi:hypothetical protein
MARLIHPHRFDCRRSRLATELVGTLDAEERVALALVLRHHVSGRLDRKRVSMVAVTRDVRRGKSVTESREDIADALTRLVAAGWLRFATSAVEGRGYFWRTDAGEGITQAAGVKATDLDPAVPT